MDSARVPPPQAPKVSQVPLRTATVTRLVEKGDG
jgi:hypothetical protein